jgi:hypothetical protein
MPDIVGRLDQYASIVAYEFDEITANNTSITGLGTYYASEFNENVVDIVRDGLVLNLDAGNLASYPGSGTTWTDVSGGSNNGTLVNTPTYSSANGGSLVFNGSTQYATLPTNLLIHETGNPFTFSIWFKTSSTGIILGQTSTSTPNSGGGYVPAIYVGTNGLLYTSCFWGGSTGNQSVTSTTVNNGNWNNITVTFSSGTQTSYLNGTSYATLAKTQTNYTSTYFYFLGTGTGASWTSFPASPYFNGSIATTSYYNKALTAAEIQQNYNALATRYGLTTTGTTAPMSANVFPPYDLVYDEFGGTFFGAGQGRYMRQNTDKSVIVYNEINEMDLFVTDISTSGMQLYIDAGISTSVTQIAAVSQELYTTPGTYTFVVPAGYTSISAVVVGGGGGGGNDTANDESGSGGGGGGLAYQASIAVTPGKVLQLWLVLVGVPILLVGNLEFIGVEQI